MTDPKKTPVPDKTLLIGMGRCAGEVLRQVDAELNNAAMIYIANQNTDQPLEQQRLSTDEIRTVFWSRLETLMHRLNQSTAALEETASPVFDVFVFGAFEDEIFLKNLPQVLWTVKTIALHHFKALFHLENNMQNARFFIHPIGFSANLQQERQKDLIIRQLAWIDNYQKLMPRGEQFIPRFYLMDGFTNSVSFDKEEIQQLLASFFKMWISTRIRRRPQIRELFDFSAYQNDFFAFLNVALLEFPIALYKEYFGARLINAFIGHIFSQEKQLSVTHSKEYVSKKLITLAEKWQQKKLYKIFEEPIRGFHLNERLARSIPAFYHYSDPIFRQLSETERNIKGYTSVKSIFLQKTYLPRLKKIAPQENLLLFFNRHWEDYIEKTLSPNVMSSTLSQLVEKFSGELERIAKNLLTEYKTSLQQSVESSLHERLGSNSLHPLLYYLKEKLIPHIRHDQKALKDTLQRELPHLPDFISHGKLTRRFLVLIRKLTRKATLSFWYLLYFILLFPVVSLLIQNAISSVKYDPLNPPFLVSLLMPPFVYGVSAIAVGFLLGLILFLKNYLLKKRIRKYLRSSYPTLAKELQESGEIKSHKLEEPKANNGVLAHSIHQLRKETRQFWEVILNFYVKQHMLRVYASLEKMVLKQIRDLQNLVNDLEAIRKDSDNTLRKYAHYFQKKRKPLVYPQEKIFHRYFLDNDWFGKLFRQRFQFRDEEEAARALYRRLDVQELLQQKYFSVKRDYIRQQAMFLIDFKDENYLELFEPKDEKDYIAPALTNKLEEFLNTLETVLSIGVNFSSYIVEEKDLQIVDSGIYLFYAEGLHRSMQHILQRQELDFNLIPTPMRPYKIMALRIVQDISLPSLVEHLESDTIVSEDLFAKLRLQVQERLIQNKPKDIWQRFYSAEEKKRY